MKQPDPFRGTISVEEGPPAHRVWSTLEPETWHVRLSFSSSADR